MRKFRRMRYLLFLFMAVSSLVSYATYQRPELLLYNGKTYSMQYVEPMEKFKDINIVKNKVGKYRVSNLWRGYRGKYEIENSMLVCKEVSIYVDREFEVVCQDVIKDGIVCDWFTKKNIRLCGEIKFPWFLGEKEYAMDVENGKVKIRVVKEMPYKRFSYEDIEARKGVEYNPDADNLDDWVELGFLATSHRYSEFKYEGWGDIDTFKKILAKKTIRTRGILISSQKCSYLRLPATRTTPCVDAMFMATYPDYVDKRVEVVIENPLQLSAKIISIRELEKWESMHNQKSPPAIFRTYEQSYNFTEELKKISFSQLKKEDIDESKLQKQFKIERSSLEFSLKYKKGESTFRDKKNIFADNISFESDKYDIIVHYPNLDLNNVNLEINFYFNFPHSFKPDIEKLLKWKLPKKILFAGIEVWDFDKETNKSFKYLIAPTEKSEEIANSLNDVEVLKAFEVLAGMQFRSDYALGLAKIKVLTNKIKNIDFKKYEEFAYLLVWAIDFKCGRESAKVYAERFENYMGVPTPFNEAFINSPDFLYVKKREEIGIKCYRLFCDKKK